MLLTLYSTESDYNVINKVLETPLNVDIIARSDFDIINPELILSRISGVDFKNYNYCHIPDLNRYYFINSVSAMNADIFRFECECDVLESYKIDILVSRAKVMKAIGVGDYGSTDLDLTGEVDISDYISDVELEPFDNSLLTVLRWA